jgi:hypothetical protein
VFFPTPTFLLYPNFASRYTTHRLGTLASGISGCDNIGALLSHFLSFVIVDTCICIGKNTIILFEHSGVNVREVPNHSYRAVAMDNRSALDIVLLCLSDNGYTISSLISDVLMRRYTLEDQRVRLAREELERDSVDICARLLNHNPSTTL